jgi:hypothetical protein
VRVDLQLGAQRVALDLQAEPDAVGRMQADRDALRERLAALGFRSVTLRIHAPDLPEAGHD